MDVAELRLILSGNDRDLNRTLDRAERRMERFANKRYRDPRLDADTRAFDDSIDRSERKIEAFGDSVSRIMARVRRDTARPATVKVETDGVQQTNAQLRGVRRSVEGLDGKSATVTVLADTKRARQHTREFVAWGNQQSASVRVGAATDDARGGVRSLLRWIAAQSASVAVGAGTDSARETTTALVRRTNSLRADIGVSAATEQARQSAEQARSRIDGLKASMGVGADTRPAQTSVQALIASTRDLSAQLKIEAVTDAAERQVRELIEWVGNQRAELTILAATGEGQRSVEGLKTYTDSLDADIGVGARVGRAWASVSALLKDVARQDASVGIGANTSGAYPPIQQIVNRANGMRGDVKVGAETSAARAELSGFNQTIRRYSQSWGTQGLRVRVQSDIRQTQAQLRNLQGVVHQVTDPEYKLRVEAEIARATGRLTALGALADSLGMKRPTVSVGVRGVAASMASMVGLYALADKLDGYNVKMGASVDDSIATALPAILGDLERQIGRLDSVTAAVTAVKVPAFYAAIASLPGVLTMAGTAVGALSVRLGAGLVGAMGSVASAGVLGGGALLTYGMALRKTAQYAFNLGTMLDDQRRRVDEAADAVKLASAAVAKATPGTQKHTMAVKGLALAEQNAAYETKKFNAILEAATPEMMKLNKEAGNLHIEFIRLGGAIANETAPVMTRWITGATSQLAKMKPSIVGMVGDMNAVADSFVRTMGKGRDFESLTTIFQGIRSAGVPALKTLTGAARLFVNVFAATVPAGLKVLDVMSKATTAAGKWSGTAEGQRKIGAVWRDLSTAGAQLWRIVVNLGSGLGGVIVALNQTGIGQGLMNGLEGISAGFRDVMRDGNGGRETIVRFGSYTSPVLDALGNLVGNLARKFGLMAMEVGKSSVVVDVINAINTALMGTKNNTGIIDMLRHEFEEIGPLLPPLIRNLGLWFATFARSEVEMVAFIKIFNTLLGSFLKLPEPLQRGIARTIAYASAIKALGGGALIGAISSLGQMVIQYRTLTATQRLATAQTNVAAGAQTRLAGAQSRTAGTANAAAGAQSRVGAAGRTSAAGLTTATGAATRAAGANTRLSTTARMAGGSMLLTGTRARTGALGTTAMTGAANRTAAANTRLSTTARMAGGSMLLTGTRARTGAAGMTVAQGAAAGTAAANARLSTTAAGAGGAMMLTGNKARTGAAGTAVAGTAAAGAGTKASRSGGMFRRFGGALLAAGGLALGFGPKAAKSGAAAAGAGTRAGAAGGRFARFSTAARAAGVALMAMAGGPVTLAIAGIAAVGVGLVVAYRRSETFRGAVKGLGRSMTDNKGISALWSQSLRGLRTRITEAGGAGKVASGFFRGLWRNVTDNKGASQLWSGALGRLTGRMRANNDSTKVSTKSNADLGVKIRNLNQRLEAQGGGIAAVRKQWERPPIYKRQDWGGKIINLWNEMSRVSDKTTQTILDHHRNRSEQARARWSNRFEAMKDQTFGRWKELSNRADEFGRNVADIHDKRANSARERWGKRFSGLQDATYKLWTNTRKRGDEFGANIADIHDRRSNQARERWGKRFGRLRDDTYKLWTNTRKRADEFGSNVSDIHDRRSNSARERWGKRFGRLRDDTYKLWKNTRKRADEFGSNVADIHDKRATGAKDRWGKRMTAMKDASFKTWKEMRVRADEFGKNVSRILGDRLGPGINKARKWLGGLAEAMSKVLKAIGMDEAAGNLESRAGKLRTPLKFARGGIAYARNGPGIVGEAGDDEAVVNLKRKTPESQMAFRAASESPNAGGGERPSRPHRRDRRPNRGSGPHRELGGPPVTRKIAAAGRATHHNIYDYIQPRVDAVMKAVPGMSWNTYQNHITSPGANEHSTVDLWGGGGRGSDIGQSKGDKAASYLLDKSRKGLKAVAWDHGINFGGGWQPYTADPHTKHVHVAWAADANAPVNKGSNTGGGGFSGVMDALGNAYNSVTDFLAKKFKPPEIPKLGMGTFGEGLTGGLSKTILGGAKDYLTKLAEEKLSFGSGGGGGPAPEGQVKDWIKSGFRMGGAFPASEGNVGAMYSRVMQESGGDPNAINRWDSNWVRGTPSKGLVQIIEPTWNANTTGSIGQFDQNWSDPVKSVAVSSRYMKRQYGRVVGSNGQGYRFGGEVPGPPGKEQDAKVHSGEIIWPRGIGGDLQKWTHAIHDNRGAVAAPAPDNRRLERDVAEQSRLLREQNALLEEQNSLLRDAPERTGAAVGKKTQKQVDDTLTGLPRGRR